MDTKRWRVLYFLCYEVACSSLFWFAVQVSHSYCCSVQEDRLYMKIFSCFSSIFLGIILDWILIFRKWYNRCIYNVCVYKQTLWILYWKYIGYIAYLIKDTYTVHANCKRQHETHVFHWNMMPCHLFLSILFGHWLIDLAGWMETSA